MSEVVGVGCEIHITQMYQLTADGLVDGVFSWKMGLPLLLRGGARSSKLTLFTGEAKRGGVENSALCVRLGDQVW